MGISRHKYDPFYDRELKCCTVPLTSIQTLLNEAIANEKKGNFSKGKCLYLQKRSTDFC